MITEIAVLSKNGTYMLYQDYDKAVTANADNFEDIFIIEKIFYEGKKVPFSISVDLEKFKRDIASHIERCEVQKRMNDPWIQEDPDQDAWAQLGYPRRSL